MPSLVSRVSLLKVALLAGGALGAPAFAMAQDTAPQEQAADATLPADEAEVGAIVVTGFRQSLQAAINVKKNAVGAVDAIVAEDIAVDFR